MYNLMSKVYVGLCCEFLGRLPMQHPNSYSHSQSPDLSRTVKFNEEISPDPSDVNQCQNVNCWTTIGNVIQNYHYNKSIFFAVQINE